jgi:3(or 17)beta-hydroxysteroid dehydrogenase
MMQSLTGMTAIVTGAGSGLGFADAMMLAQAGATVVLTDTDEAAGTAAAARIGNGACFVRQDVGEEAEWIALIAEVERRFGQLDILVNNAGLVRYADVESCTLEEFRLQNRIMAEGVFLGCKYAIPLMARSGGGSIINVSSMGSHQGFPSVFAYSAAKGAVRSMSKSIAIHCQERGYGIRCNSIHPGKINTGLLTEEADAEEAYRRDQTDAVLPPRSFGAPKDVAGLVLYLASPASRFITGAEIVIDNGAIVTPFD